MSRHSSAPRLTTRLAAYAAREAESEDPETKRSGEEAAARRLAEKVKGARKGKAVDGAERSPRPAEADEWGGAAPAATDVKEPTAAAAEEGSNGVKEANGTEGKEVGDGLKKFRGIPQDVKLFEVFWAQVVELIRVRSVLAWWFPIERSVWTGIADLQARPDLSIQDITALCVSLINLSLSCYPDRLEYVDQILAFAQAKVQEFAQK